VYFSWAMSRIYSGTGVCAGQAYWQSTTLWKYSGFLISVGFKICKLFVTKYNKIKIKFYQFFRKRAVLICVWNKSGNNQNTCSFMMKSMLHKFFLAPMKRTAGACLTSGTLQFMPATACRTWGYPLEFLLCSLAGVHQIADSSLKIFGPP
jgi:hypothetical protein